MNMSKWMLIRIGIIAIVAVSSLFTPLLPQAIPPIDWNTLIIILIFIPFALLFVVGIQAVNPFSAKVWRKPDWNLNPLNFKDPVQFFHFGAYILLVQGGVTLCRIYFLEVPFYPGVLFPLVMGIGTLLGIQIIMLIFRSKYSENT